METHFYLKKKSFFFELVSMKVKFKKGFLKLKYFSKIFKKNLCHAYILVLFMLKYNDTKMINIQKIASNRKIWLLLSFLDILVQNLIYVLTQHGLTWLHKYMSLKLPKNGCFCICFSSCFYQNIICLEKRTLWLNFKKSG